MTAPVGVVVCREDCYSLAFTRRPIALTGVKIEYDVEVTGLIDCHPIIPLLDAMVMSLGLQPPPGLFVAEFSK